MMISQGTLHRVPVADDQPAQPVEQACVIARVSCQDVAADQDKPGNVQPM